MGLPGGVRRGAPRRAAILQQRALSEVVPSSERSLFRRRVTTSDLTANGATTESSRRPDSCRRTARMGANGYPQPSRRTADLRGGAPRRKKRIAQPHRCVEVSKTRKSAHINTGVCDFLAWLPKPKSQARARSTPYSAARSTTEASRRVLRTSRNQACSNFWTIWGKSQRRRGAPPQCIPLVLAP